MISKELLSEVLEIDNVNDFVIENHMLYINYLEYIQVYQYSINIYELAHKCKVWAFNNGYSIDIYNKNECFFIEVSKINSSIWLYKSLLFDIKDEQNELIKSCEWILDNKETK